MVKWTIRNQILVPVSIVFLIGMGIATSINVWNQVKNASQQVERQAENLIGTMTQKSFPLTQASVLKQIESISGFHLIVSQNGETISSLPDENVLRFLNWLEKQPDSAQNYSAGSESFFLYSSSPSTTGRRQIIHLLYPQRALRKSIRDTVYPQVITSLLTFLVVFGLVIVVSRNVTEPIRKLQTQVEKISDGELGLTVENRGRGEVAELFKSVNEMSRKLLEYERKIRDQEKLFTLDQMGGGIAHQLRNSITGCRLAIELHRDGCEGDQESLEIAARQLEYMESFQKRFLTLGKTEYQKSVLDLAQLMANYLPILQPIARHISVKLQFHDRAKESVPVCGSRERIEQLLNNLVMNAIDAASFSQNPEKSVEVTLSIRADPNVNLPGSKGTPSSRVAVVNVIDSGDGISDQIKDRLYEPLATTRPDGVGLGLAIVKQTITEHKGSIAWFREGNRTNFELQIPMVEPVESRLQ